MNATRAHDSGCGAASVIRIHGKQRVATGKRKANSKKPEADAGIGVAGGTGAGPDVERMWRWCGADSA